LTSDEIQSHMQEQVARARAALGEALGQLQDIRQPGLDVNRVSESLARSVKKLFDAEASWSLDVALVEQAMEHLRRTLAMLQDVRGDDPALHEATATIARIMAILFPVSRALAEPEPEAPAVEDGPIPLTRKLPVRPSYAPLPLVNRRAEEQAAQPRVAPEEERREAPRRDVEVEIGFQSETNFFTGLSMDVSTGGLFVASYDIPPVGTEVNVNFNLPGGPMMSLNGIVRWVREFNPVTPDMVPGFGVSFVNLSPVEEAAINDYLARNSPLLYEDVSE
jgi:uncharacterized protein (TIGR02266 family)